MSARRVADSGFSLPSNPSYIDFPRTDGNASTWPSNASRVVDHEGQVNFYEYVDPEHFQNIRWRVLVGDAVSLKLKMPEGPNYVLRSFPDGYRLYDHNKGPAQAPRHDLYLFGPMKKRFRSVNEFIPHAIWLMADSGNDCECKYCAKNKSQRDITASMSNILRITPTQSPAPPRIKPVRDKGKGRDPMTRLKEARERDTRTYAAVQKTINPLKASASVLKQPMLIERTNDLRAIYSKTSMHIRRWFREGEVVWCALEPPISGPGVHGDVVSIDFWPGVVEEVKLKTEPIPRASDSNGNIGPSQSHTPQASSSAMQMQVDSEIIEGGKGPMLEPSDEPLPWTIRQSTRYKVMFLAVSHSITIDDDKVLPYQACMPSTELIDLMATHPPDQLKFDKDSVTSFNPSPGPIAPTLLDAISAYALAIQIASSISSYWCLTDDYELKYSIPKSPPVSPSKVRPFLPAQSSSSLSSSQMAPPTTLQEAIEAAGRHNARNPGPLHHNGATPVHPSISAAEAHDVASRVLGMPPPPDQLVQTRFQGLWWGAERIWVDDFIRLKIPRRTLAPNGDNHILPPSGAGKSNAEIWKAQDRDPAELGAGMRGIFLRLDGLITVNVENDGTTKKEARVCGMLYELADEDWEGSDHPDLPDEKMVTVEDPVVVTNGLVGPLTGPSTAVPSSQVDSASQSSTTPQRINGVIPTSEPTNSGPPIGNILPRPPRGYKFRPIIEPGYEFVGAMGLISGRYYPGILQHPRMRPRVDAALDGVDVESNNNIWALEGLSGGYFNSVDPHRYKKSRVAMMQDADKEAVTELEEYAQRRQAESQGEVIGDDDAMDIDDIYA